MKSLSITPREILQILQRVCQLFIGVVLNHLVIPEIMLHRNCDTWPLGPSEGCVIYQSTGKNINMRYNGSTSPHNDFRSEPCTLNSGDMDPQTDFLFTQLQSKNNKPVEEVVGQGVQPCPMFAVESPGFLLASQVLYEGHPLHNLDKKTHCSWLDHSPLNPSGVMLAHTRPLNSKISVQGVW